MNNLLKNLSIIIPLAPEENAWENLWQDLKDLPEQIEIILVGPQKPENHLPDRIKWIDSELGRARQLNCGARAATKDFLWFLHADSRFTPKTIPALANSLKNHPNHLHYFNLRFLPDGSPLMFINEIGCWIRSKWMKLPFGDQGFCVSKEVFEFIGAYPEDVSYGEDHVFVWRARQLGIKLRSTRCALKTSARKYRAQGWSKITRLYYKLWTKQAAPEKRMLHKIRSGQTTAVATFVKTPGISPLKTRLAKEIGEESAINFYNLSLNAIRNVLKAAEQESQKTLKPYWAVAEKQALGTSEWEGFS